MPIMSSATTVKHQPGFSLVEAMLQLTLLSIVTIPMIMALSIQKQDVDQKRESIESRMIANQLFDNVIVQDASPMDTYQIPNTTFTTKLSIYCDPANWAKSSTEYTASCGTSGTDTTKAPFFKRTVQYLPNNITPDNRNFRIKIELFKTASSTNPYYTLTRDYQLDSYRINTGITEPTNYQNALTSDFGDWIVTDNQGNPWYPAVPITTPSGNENAYYTYSACSMTKPTTTLPVPFDKYLDISSAGCSNGVTFNFRASPRTHYDLKLYLVLPANETLIPPTANCMANTANMSCILADVTVTQATTITDPVEGTTNTIYTLASERNFDTAVATATSGTDNTTSRPLILQTSFRTFTNNPIKINVRSTPGSATTHVYLAGVELIRRDN